MKFFFDSVICRTLESQLAFNPGSITVVRHPSGNHYLYEQSQSFYSDEPGRPSLFAHRQFES
ncbi:Uncharacterised protein [Serratia fonticola]|nr:Uncharacterised protein [Serratia fonticola]